MNNKPLYAFFGSAVLLATAGCNTTGGSRTDVAELQRVIETKNAETASLKASVRDLEQQVGERDVMVQGYQTRLASTTEEAPLLPPTAKPGECYARVFVPPTYRNVTEELLKHGAAEKVSVIPARYEWIEERVLVKEASVEARLVPARYDWIEERILVTEAAEKLVDQPAQYETQSEQVLVKPAYTTWKKGRGPIQKVDHATGEIMCLVEVPAEYKTVTKRVMATPPDIRKVALPAEYKTIKKRVMVEEPKMVKVEIPAEYKTVKVRKVAELAKEKRTTIPAEYQTITKREKVTDGRMQWQPILCETNVSTDFIRRLQRALSSVGHNPGPIDGVFGRETMSALTAYQREKKLASGQLTLETIKVLGIKAS